MADPKTCKSQERDTGHYAGIAIVLTVVIVGLWTILGVLNVRRFSSYAEAGTYGDSFGLVNSLFSGLALAGVVLTIYLQTKELGLQRQELEDTREELRKSAEAQERLVALNTLAALAQYYVSLYRDDRRRYETEYRAKLALGVDAGSKTIAYKAKFAMDQLESLYQNLTGKPLGDPDELRIERLRLWHHAFSHQLKLMKSRAKEVKSSPNVYHWSARFVSMVSDAVTTFSRLRTWVDAVECVNTGIGATLERLESELKNVLAPIQAKTGVKVNPPPKEDPMIDQGIAESERIRGELQKIADNIKVGIDFLVRDEEKDRKREPQ